MTSPVASSPLASATQSTTATASTAAPDQAKLKKAAQGFEAVFVRQMLSSMRTSSLGDGLFDSDATNQFRDMSDGKLADQMAGKGALGIADMLVKQWGARVAGQHPATTGAAATTGATAPTAATPGLPAIGAATDAKAAK